MENVTVDTIEIDGQEYFLLDTLKSEQNTYHFFANINNQSDIQVLKTKVENQEEYYVSLDTESEFDQAWALFYKKNQ